MLSSGVNNMLKVYGKKMWLTRGDTGILQINYSVPVTSGVFSLKKNINDTEYVLQKDVTDGILKIEHADTNDLEARLYVYDIQVTAGTDVETVMKGVFDLLPDVTRE